MAGKKKISTSEISRQKILLKELPYYTYTVLQCFMASLIIF